MNKTTLRIQMELIAGSNPIIMDAEAGNGTELECFNSCIDEISSKVNELEQRVNAVEQFYMKQSNAAKAKDRHLMSTDKQRQCASQMEPSSQDRMQELMRQFAIIFRQITQHKWAGPFMQPVDVVGLGLDDYYQVIEKPMDFGTIKKRMEAKDGTGYKNVREIYADVRLVFKNAMKYNNERQDVHVMAKTLLEKFEDKWLLLLPKVAEEEKRQVEEEAAAQLATKQAEEASHASMARDLSNELNEIDIHLEKLREMVIGRCRRMSTEEKKKLWAALTKLSPEDLTRALEIVAEDNPSFQASAEEVDLDINAQSDLTLWRLKVFVQDALKISGRNSEGTFGNKSNSNVEYDFSINNGKKIKNSVADNNNNNNNKTNPKRRRECGDALAKTPTKRTRKISLIP